MNKVIVQFREYRQRIFLPVAPFLTQIGITPNIMTFISLILGLGAVYFLFNNYILFLILGLLHLLADTLDGVLASLQGETRFGKYFDCGTDNLIALLLAIKIGYFLQDYYAYIVAGLYLVTQLVYIFSRMTAPVLFGRSVSLIALFFYIPATLSFTSFLPVLVYLFLGAISMYSLARQLQWGMGRIKF